MRIIKKLQRLLYRHQQQHLIKSLLSGIFVESFPLIVPNVAQVNSQGYMGSSTYTCGLGTYS